MLAMTDDLYKSLEDALCDTNNEKVWSWKRGTHDSIWYAEYMQEPIEGKGLLFPKSEWNRFKRADIEGKQPDDVIGATDVADESDDDFCSPFAKVFGTKYFITDALLTKENVEVTEPRLVTLVLDTRCNNIRIESNNGFKRSKDCKGKE